MPTDRPSPLAGALRHRVAAQRSRPVPITPAAPPPLPEPPRHAPLPGQLSLPLEGPRMPDGPTPNEPNEAALPASSLADRRLADVDFLVLAVVSLAAGSGTTADITDEQVSQRTGGRPQPKGVAWDLERLEACGYVTLEDMPEGGRIVLTWRNQ